MHLFIFSAIENNLKVPPTVTSLIKCYDFMAITTVVTGYCDTHIIMSNCTMSNVYTCLPQCSASVLDLSGQYWDLNPCPA